MKFFLILILLLPSSVLADPQNYPELMVAPKASERLLIEAKREKSYWKMFLPLQISGASTLAAGILTNSNVDEDKDEKGIAPKVAMVVGGAWLATAIWLQSGYKPYTRGFYQNKNLPYKTTQEQLAAERLAEEQIDQAASLAKKIKWASFTTNFGASVYSFSAAEKDSAGQAMSIVGAVASALPIFFPLKWEQVSEDQRSYKKKVFGPITFGNSLLLNPGTMKPTLGLMATTIF